MIYLLTDWQSENTQFDSNVVFNVNKVFQEGKIETKIINTQLSPFLNYFTNQFEFYDSEHFINLMDSVTEQFAISYAPLVMTDLQFPKDWEKTYTRTNVILSKNGDVKAEVFFNSFGFVSQIHYHTSIGKDIQIYSEKGVILSKQFVDLSGRQIEQQIFDEGGQLILTQWSDYVFINKDYQKRFKKETYQNLKEVCIELVNGALTSFNPEEDRILIDGSSEWLMSLVEGFDFPESIIYISTGPTQECISQVKKHLDLLKKGKQIITDNVLFQEEIKKDNTYQSLKNKVRFMPLYPTTLALGESNTFSDEYVYWQIKQVDSLIETILNDFLRKKMIIRELCLIIESEESDDEMRVKNISESFIVKNFKISFNSPEYVLVEQYFEAVKNEELTPSLRDLFNATKRENPEFSRVIEAYLFYKGITFRKKASVQELKEDFQKVRVFIDQRDSKDFLSHSLAVSTGIPILSKERSPYLINNKNGIVFENIEQLIGATETYLVDTDKWNQNLVESVELIENNSADGLVKKWKEALK